MSDSDRFLMQARTRAVMLRLAQLHQGDVVTWEELTAVLSKEAGHPVDAQTDGRHYIARARLRLLKDRGMALECITGVGVKWLTPEEVVSLGPHYRRKINRASLRGQQKLRLGLTPQQYQSLSNQQKAEYNTSLAILGFLEGGSNHKAEQQTQRNMATGGMLRVPWTVL